MLKPQGDMAVWRGHIVRQDAPWPHVAPGGPPLSLRAGGALPTALWHNSV